MQKSFGRIMDKEKIIRMDGSTRRHNRNKMIMVPLPSIPYIDYLFDVMLAYFHWLFYV